jgi:microcystin-dependent protein
VSDPFIAEVRIFAGNFAPRSWAFCDGQLLPVAQNTALFSIVGTTYGGDGRTTLGLPNLQGRVPMHPGRGPGLSSRRLGERGGSETVTLAESQIANHNHRLRANDEQADLANPTSTQYLGAAEMYALPGDTTPMASEAVADTGGSQPHNNLQPYLVVNFIIALVGLYPSRS